MKHFKLVFLLSVLSFQLFAQHAETINLNGSWSFDQSTDAFPPDKFTRTIPVPGLIHLAEPKIEDYHVFFKRPEQAELKTTHSLYDIDYKPKYSWYKKEVLIPEKYNEQEVVLTLLKSQYVTQVIVNGHDFGTFMECYTPIQANITRAVNFGDKNEILIRVGDRTWLPSQAAGSTDKEKEHYLPGIWDDVFLSFSGKIRVNRLLLLPHSENESLNVKVQLRNYFPAQIGYGDKMLDSVRIEANVYEKESGISVASKTFVAIADRDNLSAATTEINIPQPVLWTPEHPFLYTCDIRVVKDDTLMDAYSDRFGMRNFTRKGKYFYLNGEKTFLRGSNITLQRFFEDPDCGNLAWDREWVKKLLIDHPKQMNWNAMRICVGIVPDFWYDIADEYGLMIQNEWLYWQNHGWDAQIKKEYTDWVWSDGNHPSIVIWDAINENWDDYIGNQLIPELKKLDPTRIWDAGYMTAVELEQGTDEMDEPHPYAGPRPYIDANEYHNNPYPLGDLNFRNKINLKSIESSAAQLVNEYGWIWLWRNGEPSKLTVDVYKHYLGENTSAEERRELQAYWLQLETEWLRSNRHHAGVLSFCHLTNNYGYTGDWYINDIADLEPGPTMDWFPHAFAPAAVFINLTDERYTKFTKPHAPGSTLLFNLVGINDLREEISGELNLKLLDNNGNEIHVSSMQLTLPTDIQKVIPVSVDLPENHGGYLLVSKFISNAAKDTQISRRYIKVGDAKQQFTYYHLKPTSNIH